MILGHGIDLVNQNRIDTVLSDMEKSLNTNILVMSK